MFKVVEILETVLLFLVALLLLPEQVGHDDGVLIIDQGLPDDPDIVLQAEVLVNEDNIDVGVLFVVDIGENASG